MNYEEHKFVDENGEVLVVPYVYWDAPNLKITRLIVQHGIFCAIWIISYCHGEIDGKLVNVQLPFRQLKKGSVEKQISWYAACDEVAVPDGLWKSVEGIR